MGKSRKKFGRVGIAEGKNTEFYRIANQRIRAKARHIMDMLRVGHIKEENLVLPTKHRDVKADEYSEPTDGSYRYPPKELDKLKKSNYEYYRKLKNK